MIHIKHNSFSRLSSSVKRGFTLIEIMVATVIMVILVGLVIQITSEVLNVWNRSSGKLSANAEARIALDLLTQDLETAVFRNNGQQWLRVEGPEAVEASAPYQSQTVALKLFTPALDRPTLETDGVTPIPGDICAVAYRLEYRESYDQTGVTDPVKVYALYRAIARPDATFNSLMGSPSEGTSSVQYSLESAPSFWASNSIVQDNNYLVSNVVDFKVIVYVDDGTGNSAPTPANANQVTLALQGDYAFGGDGTSDPLLYADISLTVISDEGLELLQNIDEGRIIDNAVDVVREHGEVFTRRVNFLARPL